MICYLRLIAAVDHGERSVCSTPDDLVLDSTGPHGMPIYCDRNTAQSQYGFGVVYNNSNGPLLFVSRCQLLYSIVLSKTSTRNLFLFHRVIYRLGTL